MFEPDVLTEEELEQLKGGDKKADIRAKCSSYWDTNWDYCTGLVGTR